MDNISVNNKKMREGNDGIKDEEEKYCHLKKLHRIAEYAFYREFSNLYSYIDSEYFIKKVFNDNFYKSADDFIFRMDVTYLSYSQALKMAYKDLQKGDYYSYLLALKTIIVKLNGNHRYTYYDRDEILDLLNEMKSDYYFDCKFEKDIYIPKILLNECKKYLPIGFHEMTFEEYYNRSTNSYFNSFKKLDEKILENEFKIAVRQGSIYHYIVEIDHYINTKYKEITAKEWIFLSKLLSTYYGEEKNPWSRDMTTDLLRTYLGIKDLCSSQEFENILFQLVTGTLKIIIKKISLSGNDLLANELIEIINFLINVYTLDNNKQYLVYIDDFLKMVDRIENTIDLSGIYEWMNQK
ncbi:hypothetical protein FDN13_09270 [Caloramator sp. E03]|uniref:hypothetical protein n=1 Tax=Caloramator sp. E03 TaxID=2576307 RepID=UPI001110457C|nr:hypothetical protein [Caloramator sp. E03]QCX33873.1 hypothetical protein FDN13_09270 [Caloramator sp. E03]